MKKQVLLLILGISLCLCTIGAKKETQPNRIWWLELIDAEYSYKQPTDYDPYIAGTYFTPTKAQPCVKISWREHWEDGHSADYMQSIPMNIYDNDLSQPFSLLLDENIDTLKVRTKDKSEWGSFIERRYKDAFDLGQITHGVCAKFVNSLPDYYSQLIHIKVVPEDAPLEIKYPVKAIKQITVTFSHKEAEQYYTKKGKLKTRDRYYYEVSWSPESDAEIKYKGKKFKYTYREESKNKYTISTTKRDKNSVKVRPYRVVYEGSEQTYIYGAWVTRTFYV